jgi:integrase
MRLSDIRDDALHVQQGKTGKRLRIAIEGELARVIKRIQDRSYKVTSLALVRREDGQPLSYFAMDGRFENARKAAAETLEKAAVDACDDEIASRLRESARAVREFQFRDLRAKAGTDKADTAGIQAAQRQLGHNSVKTTEIYVRARVGEKVKPTR